MITNVTDIDQKLEKLKERGEQLQAKLAATTNNKSQLESPVIISTKTQRTLRIKSCSTQVPYPNSSEKRTISSFGIGNSIDTRVTSSPTVPVTTTLKRFHSPTTSRILQVYHIPTASSIPKQGKRQESFNFSKSTVRSLNKKSDMRQKRIFSAYQGERPNKKLNLCVAISPLRTNSPISSQKRNYFDHKRLASTALRSDSECSDYNYALSAQLPAKGSLLRKEKTVEITNLPAKKGYDQTMDTKLPILITH